MVAQAMPVVPGVHFSLHGGAGCIGNGAFSRRAAVCGAAGAGGVALSLPACMPTPPQVNQPVITLVDKGFII